MSSRLFSSLLFAQFVLTVPMAWTQFPMRGIQTDLLSTADRFIPLDLNGDGKSDMLYYRPGSGYAGVYLSHGDGTFRYISYADNGTNGGGFPSDLKSAQDTFVALDLNGDGRSDFIEYRPGSGYAMGCLSVGDGSVKCTTWSSPSGQVPNMKDNFMNGSEHVVALDLNGDGLSDFIVYSPGHSTARAYLYHANGTLSEVDLTNNPQSGFPGDLSDASDTFVALDLNGDGKSDFIEYRPGKGWAFECLSKGDGTFTCDDLSQPNGTLRDGMTDTFLKGQEHVVPLDLNGDGRSDFIVYTAVSGDVHAYISTAAPTCTVASCPGVVTLRSVAYSSGGTNSNVFEDEIKGGNPQMIALDINGDGKSDFLLYQPGHGTARAYLSNGPLASGTANDQLIPVTYRDGYNLAHGFINDVGSTADTAVALNFLGSQPRSGGSGFLWYRPGSGISGMSIYAPDYLGDLKNYGYALNTSTWMSDLSWSIANTPLKAVVMPGTHDAAMFYGGGSGDYAITQQQTFLQQLEDGARVLDFRFAYLQDILFKVPLCCYDLGGDLFKQLTGVLLAPNQLEEIYMTGHGSYTTAITMKSALTDIVNFLNANPKEIVVLVTDDVLTGGGSTDGTDAFRSEVQSVFTSGVQMYTPYLACQAANCAATSVQPQNVTPAQLWKLNARLILISTTGDLANLGFAWGSSQVNDYVGYCDWTTLNGHEFSGSETDEDELACSEVGATAKAGAPPSVQYNRPYFLPAVAAPHFLELNTALTPFTGLGDLGRDLALTFLSPYDNATCGDPGAPVVCADGSLNINQYMYRQLNAGRWGGNALNFWLMDAIQPEYYFVQKILAQNNEVWSNASFFNPVFPQPAGAIASDANGNIWAAGRPGGHAISIYRYGNPNIPNANAGNWESVVPSAPNVKKLAVDLRSNVYWVETSNTSSAGAVQISNGFFIAETGYTAQDIAAGGDGNVWIIGPPGSGSGSTPQEGGVIRITSTPNSRVPADIGGAGIAIAVDRLGAPWIVNGVGEIWRYNTLESAWEKLPPFPPAMVTNLETGDNTLTSDTAEPTYSDGLIPSGISIGADGSVLVTASYNGTTTQTFWGRYLEYTYHVPPNLPQTTFWRWDPSTQLWRQLRMDAQAAAVDPNGQAWVIRPDGTVYKGVLDNM
jgi:hypothetical protein